MCYDDFEEEKPNKIMKNNCQVTLETVSDIVTKIHINGIVENIHKPDIQ